jgi:pimeloyl-ACP methyl ester carboxylesterase
MDMQPTGELPNERWAVSESAFAAGGVRLHYLDARRRDADQDGRLTLMLHGMTSHGDAWRPIVGRLSAPTRCVCPDLRGHGQSDWTSEGYWLADYAADLVALVGRREVAVIHPSLPLSSESEHTT